MTGQPGAQLNTKHESKPPSQQGTAKVFRYGTFLRYLECGLTDVVISDQVTELSAGKSEVEYVM